MDKFCVDEWLRYVNNDIETVHILSQHHPLQLEIICFHCQQAAEKVLKAFLIYNDIDPPRVHNLNDLLDLCINIAIDFTCIKDECAYLNPYAVDSRYPLGFTYIEEDAILSIQNCEKIVGFVKQKIDIE